MEPEAGKTHSPSLQMGGKKTPLGYFLSFKMILNSEKLSVFQSSFDIWQAFVLNPEETYAIIT